MGYNHIVSTNGTSCISAS